MVYLLLEFVVIDLVVETAAGWASARICWCLSLSLNGLDDFPGLLVDLSEWIHWARLSTLVDQCVSILTDTNLAWYFASIKGPSWWSNNHLSLSSMVHLRLLPNSRCDVQTWGWATHHNLVIELMLSNIGWMLLSLVSYFELLHLLFTSVTSPRGDDRRILKIPWINAARSCVRWNHRSDIMMTSWYVACSALSTLLCVFYLPWLQAGVTFYRHVLLMSWIFDIGWDWQSITTLYGLIFKSIISSTNYGVSCFSVLLYGLIHLR